MNLNYGVLRSKIQHMRLKYYNPMKDVIMIMKRYRTLLLLFLPLTLLLACSEIDLMSAEYPVAEGSQRKEVKKVPDRHCSLIASLTVQLLAKEHYTGKKLDAELSRAVFDEYFRELDPNHIFFLKSDVDAFEQYRDTLASSAMRGNLDFAFSVYNLRTQRLREYRDFVHAYLSKEVKYNADEVFDYDRDDAAWPVTAEERRTIWEKRVKNTLIVANLSDRANEEKAKKDEQEKKAAEEKGETSTKSKTNNSQSLLDPVARIIKRADTLYSYSAEVEAIDVLEAYLMAFTAVYDPHSAYMSPASGEDFDIQMSLNLTGIGATLTSEDGYTKVVQVVTGGPADKQGELKENDRIIEVQQEGEAPVDVVDMALNKVVSMIRGKEGTYVTLTVLPARQGGQAAPTKIRIQRGKVPMSESAASGKIHEIKTDDGQTLKIGVIDLPSFYMDYNSAKTGSADYRSSFRDMAEIIEKPEFKEADGIIIDLRSNGGGGLVESVKIAGLFITEGPVVQVKDRSTTDVMNDEDGGRIAYEGPMIVLVNHGSASASEILAAALKDYKRALIVGDPHTHGKGSVQVVQNLDKYMLFLASENFKAGEIKLTNAKFYRVNGESTQLNGVAADIVLPGMSETDDTGERSLRNALPWDTIASSNYKIYNGKYRVTDELINKLKQSSEKRISENEEFQKLLALIHEVEEIQKKKTVSLDPEKRWQEYQKLQALEDELTTISKDRRNSPKKTDEKEEDPNLTETLNIMADYIRECKK